MPGNNYYQGRHQGFKEAKKQQVIFTGVLFFSFLCANWEWQDHSFRGFRDTALRIKPVVILVRDQDGKYAWDTGEGRT